MPGFFCYKLWGSRKEKRASDYSQHFLNIHVFLGFFERLSHL